MLKLKLWYKSDEHHELFHLILIIQ